MEGADVGARASEHSQGVRLVPRRQQCRSDCATWHFCLPARTVGLWQDNLVAHDRWARPAELRQDRARRPGHYQRANAPARAKTEYELYLKLFPEGEGAQRVAQRLANLDLGQAAPAPGLRPSSGQGTPAAEPSTYSGSIAQYYFGGKARTQSLVNLSSGIEQATLSRTTESAIVTSVDLGARFVSPDSETRAVLRGTGSTNLQTTSRNPSLVNAFYVDHKRTASGLAIRVGRQTAISGGLLGLFDGVGDNGVLF